MAITRAFLLVIVSTAIVACRSSSSPGPTPSTFAGTYTTRVTLTSNDCGQIVVQDNPTVVTYDATTHAVTLTHAGTTYTGTVVANNSFSTVPRQVTVGDGFTYTIAIAGSFRANGFDADATVDRSGQGTSCRFVVHWVGTK